MNVDDVPQEDRRVAAPASPSKGQTRFSSATYAPLKPQDINTKHQQPFASRHAGIDTPPPSSPLPSDSEFRGARSSSITAIFSSSPPREQDSFDTSSVVASSPIKPAYRARPSFGTPHAVAELSSADPHAGLKQLETASQSDDIAYTLYGSFTHALLIGRSKPTGQPHASEESIPPSTPGVGSKPTQHVPLPNHARHVSRRHAIIEWLPFSPNPRAADSQAKRTPSGGFVVRILGQNGLIVNGKRRREGHVLKLEPGKSTIDFFGVKTIFQVHSAASRPTHAKKTAARASLPGADGSSPSKSGSGGVQRSASMRSLGSGSQEAVSQLLGAEPLLSQLSGAASRYVKTTSGKDAPISPPSSSPVASARSSPAPLATSSSAEEPLSPSLGRGRAADLCLSMPPLSLGAGVGSEELTERPSKQPRTTAPPPPTDGAESDLTPSPSPEPAPRAKSTAAASQAPFASRARPFKLTTSQVMMPPPKLPASAARAPSSASSSPAPSGADSQQLRNALRDQARACVAALAPTYDLEGLLAGAIVFHRTATISASEAVRSVLASTQGLMRGEVGATVPKDASTSPLKQGQVVTGWGAEHLLSSLSSSAASERWTSTARRAWTERLESVLQSKPMFGQIHRAGKDAAGHSLEHWYYYDASGDEDKERAANLGSLAKPIRGALKTHKPIFWKKSAYPRSAEETRAEETTTPSSGAAAEAAMPAPSASWLLKDGPMGDSQIGPATPIALSVRTVAAAAAAAKASSSRSARPVLDEHRIWEETQPEERESTWDKEGDMDWSGRAGAGTPGPTSASKRKRR